MSTTAPDLLQFTPSFRRHRLYATVLLLAVVTTPFLVWRGLSQRLFASDFLPHMYCYLGKPGLIWTHVVSDSTIAVAYLAISLTLGYLVYRARRDIPFHWMLLAFGLFIIACGGTHLVEVVTIWKPVYVLSAAIKVFTATVSLTTAAALPFTVPKALALVQKAKAAEQAMAQVRRNEAQQEQLMHELRERKEMFECFFESSPDAIFVTDKTGRITDFNQQAKQMFGYSREELVGNSIEILVPEELRDKHRLQRHGYVESPKMRPMGQGLDLYARHKDGKQYPVDITLSPLHAGGEPRVLAAVRDMTEHKVAQEKIRESLREKEVLLREVHHRVKNNLAVICSLFYLESTYAKDEHTARVFRESENRVHSMALVHETLYGSENLSRIDFSEYAKVLASDILSSYGNHQGSVQLKTEMQPVIMSIDLAVPCGLILNELISNAFKHGFPNGRNGEITVRLLAQEDSKCSLRVEDDGAGLPTNFDVNSTKSLGLRLVRSLTKQIRGSFELVRAEPGSSARLEFSPNYHAH